MNALSTFINNVVAHIITPLVTLLFALAVFFLVNGVAVFLFKADDPKAREVGRSHLLWGVVGMFIMISVISILAVVTNTFCPGHPFCRGY